MPADFQRAYSLLTVKAVEDDRRIITGTATTPAPDRIGDIVEPLGVRFKNPLPLLHQHDSRSPVGTVRFDKPTKAGITFTAQMPKIEEPGPLKDRVDTAWGEVKAGLVRAVSIGFRPLEFSIMEDGGYRFTESEVLELSLVTIPAQAEATIQTIKSVDQALLAASGHGQREVRPHHPAGATATLKSVKLKGTGMPKTIAEQISAFEATRAAKAARMDEIMTKSGETGETLDAAQAEEYDGLKAELKAIDDHLVRLGEMQKAQAAKAVAVDGVKDPASGSQVRGGAVVTSVKSSLPKGTAFTRYVMALAKANGNRWEAAEISKAWRDSTPEVETVLKAAVAAGTTTDATWAAPLVEYQVMASEFIELLRPATIIGRIPGLRRVPFNIKVPRTTTGSTVGWVGQGKPKPVSAMAFDSVTLTWAKAAGIVVLTEELVRFSNPAAEGLVRQDLIAAMAQFLDRQFIDPDVAAVSDTSPASVTNGASTTPASGTTADALRADVKTMFQAFATANQSIAGSVWVMSERIAIALMMMQNALGQSEFPGITATGGTLFGLPVVTSESVEAFGSPAQDIIVLLKPNDIMLADDGQVMIDISREASLQMDGAPDAPATASTVLVSLWQHNMIGVRAERWINWKVRRSTAVRYIREAAYSA